MSDSLAPTFEEEEDISAAETFEELCRMCEKGLHEHVTETMISNPLAESTWINQRRERDLATPIFIAASWGHSDTVAILLHSGANPHLRARSCKADLCVRGFPCKPPLNGEPGRPCPGYTNPEHPDDAGYTNPEHPDNGGVSALESAKNRGLSHVIRLIKHHTLNCAVHGECVKFRRDQPEDFLGTDLGREPPRDDPCHIYPAPMPPAPSGENDSGHPDPWPFKHYGRPFRAAEEGDLNLLKRLVREWYEAQEFADDEVLNEGAEVPGTEKRPNPMEDRHPTTRETLLHVAARQEKASMVKFLLHGGADATATDRHHCSAFWHACRCGRISNAVLLAKKLTTRELRRPQGLDHTSPAAEAARNQHHVLAGWIGEEIAQRLRSKGVE